MWDFTIQEGVGNVFANLENAKHMWNTVQVFLS